ncbi:MAG: superoxide dismutase family protein [Burkholderiaceae bacterium]|nr:superoxide dismutase family protein [Burkholderiaceae bacterium]
MQHASTIPLAALALAGCAVFSPGPTAAVAELMPTEGNFVAGSARFEEHGGKVVITAEIRGLPPGGEHGFHVHEKGDCSSPDAMSAGGHFNPGGKPHAHYGQAERHAGDMPNLLADADGVAKFRFETTVLTVRPGPASVIGRALVVHRDPDDYKSQPAGNSGPRIACGVIRAAS